MADVNLPSINELGAMGGMDFGAYQQAQNQIGLANLFQQQNLASGAADLQTKNLANQYSEQANPLRLDKLGLENVGTGYDNTLKRVESETKAALQGDDIASKRQKMLADMDETKLKQLETRAQWEMMQEDPKVRESGMRKLMASKAEWERRNKHTDDMEKIKLQGQNSMDVAKVHAGATERSAQISADARRQIAESKNKGVASFDDAVRLGKFKTIESALTYATIQLQTAESLEDQQAWAVRAKQFEDLLRNKALASSNGKIDPGAATNLPTIQVPSAIRVPTAPTAQPGMSGGFDLGPNQEKLPAVVDAIRKIANPQERANAAKALESQVNGMSQQAPRAAAIPGSGGGARIPVVSPDGKMGSVPPDQLEAAMAAGYKKR